MFSPSGIKVICSRFPGEKTSYSTNSRIRLEREYDEFLRNKREEEKKNNE